MAKEPEKKQPSGMMQVRGPNLYNSGGDALAPYSSAEGAPGMIIGVNDHGSDTGVVWRPETMRSHALTFGTTREGMKGTTAIIPALLSYTGSMVVIDPKGENAWATADRRRQLGQRVVLLDPWDEVNRRYGSKVGTVEQVTRFNPLSGLRPDDLDFADDCQAVADAIVVDRSHDPHWSDSARDLVAGCVAAVVEANPGKATLGDVRKLVTAPLRKLEGVIRHCLKTNPDGVAASLLGGFLVDDEDAEEPENEGEPGKIKKRRGSGFAGDFKSIRSAARTQTAVLVNKRLQSAMETDVPPFDLAELATGKVTLFLVLPLDRLQSHGKWLRLILTLAIRAIARQDTPPNPPVMFLLDEMGTIGRLAMVEQAFGLMAGVGIRVWAFLQDLNQLKRDYPESWETFIANSSIIQVLNARDQTTVNYVMETLGKKVIGIPEESVSFSTSASGGSQTTNKTVKFETLPLLEQSSIQFLPLDWQILILAGRAFSTLRRTQYFRDDRWYGLYRPNPLFPPPKPPAPKPEPEIVVVAAPAAPPSMIDKERVAELAGQGLAVGKMAAGWAAGKLRERMQQRPAGGSAAPPTPHDPPSS